MTWLAWLLLATNAVTASAWAVRARTRHQHAYQAWDAWIPDHGIPDPGKWDRVTWVRYRTCRTCAKTERQTTGRHDCIYRECPHKPADDRDRISRLERDLGIDP